MDEADPAWNRTAEEPAPREFQKWRQGSSSALTAVPPQPRNDGGKVTKVGIPRPEADMDLGSKHDGLHLAEDGVWQQLAECPQWTVVRCTLLLLVLLEMDISGQDLTKHSGLLTTTWAKPPPPVQDGGEDSLRRSIPPSLSLSAG